MKYYIIAGEASGDLYASQLMKFLKVKDPDAEFRFWGGGLMQAEGGVLVKHYRDLAFMGFVEVLCNLRTILRNISFCKKDIHQYQPDVLLLVDYPGFNLRIARWAHKLGINVHYYISPQVWAWNESRVKSIKRDIDRLYVILPFEKDFYEQKHHFKVDFVGHPLIDLIQEIKQNDSAGFRERHALDKRPIIALLPGSRRQEIKRMLPVMLSIIDDFKEYQFVIAGAPSQEHSFYKSFFNEKKIRLIQNETYDLLTESHAALVTSGTATLETALFKVPEVVCYKANEISYYIGKKLVTIDYISLVNLIMNKEVVTELIQHDFTSQNLANELRKILDKKHREQLLREYDVLEKLLGGKGALQKTAGLIVNYSSKASNKLSYKQIQNS